MKNYYSILGVPENCSQEEIKKAYRKMARKFHPDSSHQESSAKFRDVQEAYENLRDADKRKSYDKELDKFRNAKESTQNSSPWSNFSSRANEIDHLTNIFDRFFIDSAFHGVLEIELDAHEAKNGKILPIEIPVRMECPHCYGFGRQFFFFDICPYCSGSGFIDRLINFTLKIPPDVKNGDQFAMDLPHIGKIKIAVMVN